MWANQVRFVAKAASFVALVTVPMVYVALATSLGRYPVAVVRARIVVVAETVMGLAQAAVDAVGVVPFVVQRTVAPGVVLATVTVWVDG
jgi:hypothetical protein